MDHLPVKRVTRLLLLSVACALLAACASLSPTAINPAQSPSDPNRYRLLTLDNQMQVLLISDPDTPKAAASLDVMVGSGENPPGRGGLAHFLEHMLFLGTDKYPDAAEYERYISEHGGTRNAYTSFEHTNYFFDVHQAYLPEALDRFAQFFIAPRFDAEYVEREKNAVQAEYQMGLKSDARRGLDVLQEVMNEEHPFSQFSVGSLDTLADRPDSPIRAELLTFYDRFYSANTMRLVVLGSQSLDRLERLVTPIFSQVPNKSVQPQQIDAPLFEEGSLPTLVQIRPQATQRQLQVSFPVDDYRGDYRANPLSYLGNLVGHEGEGSLLSQLKAEGLAESLSAGSGLGWRGGSLFTVNVLLTERGVADYPRVLQLLFAYTQMLRVEGPKAWIYDEQSRLAELSFRFKEQAEPMGYVAALSSGMHYYAAEDVLRGPFMMDQYRPDELRRLFSRLVPENALVILSHAGAETDRESDYYGVPYSVRQPDATELARWTGAAPDGVLHLPAPNEFIAEDVSLVSVRPDNPGQPVLAHQSERLRVWFRQDDEFRVPRGASYVNFRSPLVGQSAEQTASAVLYTALLKDATNEFTYPALLAGLRFDLYKHAQGISLRVSGYNDKQLELLDRILAVRSADFDAARFENIRQDMIRSLRNSVAKRPSSQVIDDLREALVYGEWGEEALVEALQKLDLAAVRAYAAEFWASADAEALVFGNYDPAQVELLAARISQQLSRGPAPELPDLKVLRLNAGESLQYAVDVPHDDSVVAWYLQGEGNSWDDRAATALTAQVIKSGFFQQLRTEQQLGYIVSALSWPRLDVPGLVLLVQSPSHSAVQVSAAIEAFMESVEGDIDSAQFSRHRAALANQIRRPDKNMWERAEFYWQSIAKKQYDFDGRDRLARAVEALSRDEWLAYFNRVFRQQPRSLQVVAPGKWGELPPEQGTVMRSADEIKDGHPVYVID